MSKSRRTAEREAFEDKIMWHLLGRPYTLSELAEACQVGRVVMSKAIGRLLDQGRIQELKSGRWWRSVAEWNRIRALASLSVNRIPAPPYQTPDVGWWG